MKKQIVLTLFLVFVTMVANAQEKGLYLALFESFGATTLGYTADTYVKSSFNLSNGTTIKTQYFFTRNWGVSIGVGFAFYKSEIHYNNTFTFKFMDDAPPTPCDLTLTLDNWKETQKSYFLEIPLMAMYQKKVEFLEKIGIYFGFGAKLQLPFLSNKYEVSQNSKLSVIGYYPDYDLTIDYSDDNRFGTDDTGDFKMKLGLSASVELGILISLHKRCDLVLDTYVDYALLDMQGNNMETYLISLSTTDKLVRDRIQYNGLLNSASVYKVKPWSVGAKVGVRVKLGKLRNHFEEKGVIEMF